MIYWKNKIHTIKITDAIMLKLCLFHTQSTRNLDMFRSISIIFRGLMSINKACIYKHGWIIKYIKICR